MAQCTVARMREFVEKEVLICHTLFGHSPQESQERKKSKSRGGMYQTASINPLPPGSGVPSFSRKLDSALRWRHLRGLHNWERKRDFRKVKCVIWPKSGVMSTRRLARYCTRGSAAWAPPSRSRLDYDRVSSGKKISHRISSRSRRAGDRMRVCVPMNVWTPALFSFNCRISASI